MISQLLSLNFTLLFHQWSLERPKLSDPVTIHQQNSTVPFLLQLASMSTTLLRSLSMDVLHTCKISFRVSCIKAKQNFRNWPCILKILTNLFCVPVTPKVLSQLAEQSADWLSYYGGREAFQDLLVHLVLRCPTGAPTILSLVVDCAAPPSPNLQPTTPEEIVVQKNGQEFLGTFY